MGQHHFRRFRYGYGLLAVICLLILARALLPFAVKDYVNRALSENPRYRGHVDHIHMALWRGAYEIDGIEIRQVDSASKEPFVSGETMEVSVLWSALFEGVIVTRMRATNLRLSFAAAQSGGAAQTGRGANWIDLLKKLSLFRIDRLEVVDGQLHYYDPNRDPPVDIYLNQIDAVLTNLTNHEKQQQRRVATLHLNALVVDQAALTLDLKVDPFAQKPDFELKERLMGLDVTRMRDLLRAYTLVDPKQGTLDVVTELDGKDGNVHGYIKPLFHNLELLQWKHVDQEKNPLHFLADAVGSVLNLMFQNQRKDQLATVVPIDGPLESPGVDAWSVFGNLLKNALVRAFTPTFEKSAKTQ